MSCCIVHLHCYRTRTALRSALCARKSKPRVNHQHRIGPVDTGMLRRLKALWPGMLVQIARRRLIASRMRGRLIGLHQRCRRLSKTMLRSLVYRYGKHDLAKKNGPDHITAEFIASREWLWRTQPNRPTSGTTPHQVQTAWFSSLFEQFIVPVSVSSAKTGDHLLQRVAT